MLTALKEKRLARRISRKLLRSYRKTRRANPDLGGNDFYREVLQHSKLVSVNDIDKILFQSEDSADEWTSVANNRLQFRHIVHFLVMSHHKSTGGVGSVVSFRDIVYALIPEDL